jgi:indoleamine 2,3-dioxygenase
MNASPWCRGFLPQQDPCVRLPVEFDALETLAAELPSLLREEKLTEAIASLPQLDLSSLSTEYEERAMLILSFLAHGALWERRHEEARRVPRTLALPWWFVATRLSRPPVLSYASHALMNWARLDLSLPLGKGNLQPLLTFTEEDDEKSFITAHVLVEAGAALVVQAVLQAQAAVSASATDELERALTAMIAAEERMVAELEELPRSCAPSFFFQRIQPFLRGFREAPVVYEGVEAYRGHPQDFVGASAAQGALLALLDAALGVRHDTDGLEAYLRELRRYMPLSHRTLLADVEGGPDIRAYVRAARSEQLELAYDRAVELLVEFREAHIVLTVSYIVKQAGPTPGELQGTGGTPFIRYLKKHLNDTRQCLIGRS